MTACILHPSDDPPHPPEPGWLCCWNARARLAHWLGPVGIPRLFAGLRLDKGVGKAVRVSGSREAPLPLRVDPLDLSLPARPASVAVKHRGDWSQVEGGDPDQLGHRSVATDLQSWARDWASERGEHDPDPSVPVLCSWLLDRLDWACTGHLALDEFAKDLERVHGVLVAVSGELRPRPKEMEAPCPSCDTMGLRQAYPDALVECVFCPRVLTPPDYAAWCVTLAAEPHPVPASGES